MTACCFHTEVLDAQNCLSWVEASEATSANSKENDMETMVFDACASFSLLPENELLTEAQCKGITKASILHDVNDLAPAEAALPLHKPA